MLIVRPLWSTQMPHAPVAQWQWLRSRDGLSADGQGTDAAALLPRDKDMVLLVPAHQLSWHQVQLPRLPQHKVRSALSGLLEERLLADAGDVHLALSPDFEFGRPSWVAAVQKTLLNTWVAALQAADRPVARIVPEQSPLMTTATPQLHAWMEADQAWVALSSSLGVSCWPLPAAEALAVQGGAEVGAWMRAWASAVPTPAPESARLESWERDSEPACLTQAETTLGLSFQLQAPAARYLRAVQSDWELAQFDLKLSAQARRSQRLHQVMRHLLHSRPWRAARWGVVALGLSAVSVVAALTWQEQQLLAAKQQHIRQTLTEVFPHISLVLDAPVQMQREVAALQRSRGSLGQGDVEVLLHDLGPRVPSEALVGLESNASLIRLRFALGTDAVVQTAVVALQQKGWQVQASGLVLEAQRAPSTATPSLNQ